MLEAVLLCGGGAAYCAYRSLQAGVSLHRQQTLRQFYDSVLKEPIPPDIMETLAKLK